MTTICNDKPFDKQLQASQYSRIYMLFFIKKCKKSIEKHVIS